MGGGGPNKRSYWPRQSNPKSIRFHDFLDAPCIHALQPVSALHELDRHADYLPADPAGTQLIW